MSYWIGLEGADGCGKSTAAVALKTALELYGKSVTLLRHPGATAFGEYLRSDVGNIRSSPARALAFLASWIELTDDLDNRCSDEIVIFDRTWMSMLAYQKLPISYLSDICGRVGHYMQDVDLTYILITTYDTHYQRLWKRREVPYPRSEFNRIQRCYADQQSRTNIIMNAEAPIAELVDEMIAGYKARIMYALPNSQSIQTRQ